MLRICSLLRNKQILNKNIFRAGMPGWDRPDPPPTQRVPRETIYSNQELIYTFFDSSMPEYVLTQPQIYEGTHIQALPNLFRLLGFFIGSAFAVSLFFKLNNPLKVQRVYQPQIANYRMTQQRKLVEGKAELKNMKQNPFGLKINTQQYPAWNYGKLVYSPQYHNIEASVKLYGQINKQARSYLTGLQQRSKHKIQHKKEENHHDHGHH